MTNDSNTTGKKIIGLMGPFGTGNLGDAAIQQAMLQNVHRLFQSAEVYGFSLNPKDTYDRHGIKSFPIGRMARNGWLESDDPESFTQKFLVTADRYRRSPGRLDRILAKIFFSPLKEIIALLRASRHLKNMDYMIVSGGGQLDDYWGGAWHHPYTLLIWGLMARLQGVRYFFISVGAGPLDSAISKLFIRWALSLATYRSFRDQDSKNFIERCGFFRENDLVCSDLAFSLDITPYTPYKNSDFQNDGEGLVVGIGPMIYFKPGAWPEQDQVVYENYLKKLALFTAWLIENHYKVVMFTGEAIADRPVIYDLRCILGQMGIEPTPDQMIEEPINTVDDLMGQLAKTDITVGSRFHGVLLSLLLNKPVIALSYHSKISELMKDTGQESYCLSIDEFEVEELQKVFDRIVANKAVIKTQIAGRVSAYREALAHQYDIIFKTVP